MVFEANDYLDVIDRYYEPSLRRGGRLADLSGWEFSPQAVTVPVTVGLPAHADLARYYADSGRRLNEIKKQILPALELLDGNALDPDGVMLLPSTTVAINIILYVLKSAGIRRIVVEAPAYFAVMDAAQRIGLPHELVAPIQYPDGSFATDLPTLTAKLEEKDVCVWLHQPRYSVGDNLSPNVVGDLLSRAGERGFLVVDEANDDTSPSVLGANGMAAANLFRLRSLSKPIGLNGVRLAILMHSPRLRDEIVDTMWSTGGALDWFSVSFAKSLTSPPRLYADLLAQTREKLNTQRDLVAAALSGTPMNLLPGRTGSLGAIRLDWRGLCGSEGDKREALIRHLACNGIPAMLGAHCHFPKTVGFEHVRVNLFNESATLRDAVTVLHSFLSSASG